MKHAERTRLAIFKSQILLSTQTFIPDQAQALRRYEPHYIGIDTVPGCRLAQDAVVVSRGSSLKARFHRYIYKTTGVAPRFKRQLQSLGIRLVHAHFVMDAVLALPLVKDLNVPFVVTLHGHLPTSYGRAVDPRSPAGRLYASRLTSLWRRTDRFICVSSFIRDKALEMGYPEHKLVVHYIGTRHQHEMAPASDRDQDLVLFVGRLVKRKGVSHLVHAMRHVQSVCEKAKLIIVGDGPERASLEAQAQQAGIDCRFVGELSSALVMSQMRRARVFCGPSLTGDDGDSEALGMVFAEAQSLGLPVVSYRHGGIPEVVLDGKTGLLADEGDTAKLSAHLIRMLTDRAFWSSCSEAAALWVRNEFDLERQTSQLEEIYDDVINAASVMPSVLCES
jgi:colanic acid/amylovoran biosynthesis glycosyltransferase